MTLAERNKRDFHHPPTITQIEDFIKELGIKVGHFEYFYGIPQGTIRQVRYGSRKLAANYWHYIYLKIVPKHGSSYLPVKNTVNKSVTKNVTCRSRKENNNTSNNSVTHKLSAITSQQ